MLTETIEAYRRATGDNDHTAALYHLILFLGDAELLQAIQAFGELEKYFGLITSDLNKIRYEIQKRTVAKINHQLGVLRTVAGLGVTHEC
jgi:hypothetical protein